MNALIQYSPKFQKELQKQVDTYCRTQDYNAISDKSLKKTIKQLHVALGTKMGVTAEKDVKKATKGATAEQKKAYKEKVTIPAKRVVKEAKKELKIESKALKAANKPTKASKTFIGSNNNLSPSVRRDIIVNQTKPARPNRERGGSLKTLRKQGKTSPTPPRNKSK